MEYFENILKLVKEEFSEDTEVHCGKARSATVCCHAQSE